MSTATPPLTSQAEGLHNPPSWLRDQVVRYVARVETRADAPLPFRDNPQPGAPADIETTVWALAALRQVGADEALERARPRALAALRAAYNPDLGIYEPTATQIGGGPGAWADALRRRCADRVRVAGRASAAVSPRPGAAVRISLGASRGGRLAALA